MRKLDSLSYLITCILTIVVVTSFFFLGITHFGILITFVLLTLCTLSSFIIISGIVLVFQYYYDIVVNFVKRKFNV